MPRYEARTRSAYPSSFFPPPSSLNIEHRGVLDTKSQRSNPYSPQRHSRNGRRTVEKPKRVERFILDLCSLYLRWVVNMALEVAWRKRVQAQLRMINENTGWMLDKGLASVLSTKLLNRRESGWPEPNLLLFVILFWIAITRWCQILITFWNTSDQSLTDFGESLNSDICRFGE